VAKKRGRKRAKKKRRPSRGHDLDQKERQVAMGNRSETNQEEPRRLIASFDKNAVEEVRVHLVEWRDRVYVDIRTWRKPKPGEGAAHPMTGGFRIAAELLSNLRSAIDAAIDHLEGGVEVKIVQDQEKV
jgi:hypothetical protein